MKRLILFSHVTEVAQQRVFPLLFPSEIQHKVFACMPSEGSLSGRRYELFSDSWRSIADQYNAEFLYIDNAKEDSTAEKARLKRANILLITGGNACALLRNLRRSSLDEAIIDFTRKDQYILAGYSAGAMILTPSVQLAAFEPWENENAGVGLTNFDALHLVDYEIFPHYSEERRDIFELYRKTTPNLVEPIGDDEYILVDIS